MNTKICNQCKIEKKIDDFYESKKSVCKKCLSENYENNKNNYKEKAKQHWKKYFKKNRDKINERKRERGRKRREKYPERELIESAKKRAKKNNLDFNITEEDVFIPNKCPLLGLELRKNENRVKDNSPSLDRIDNSKGYIKGNVRVVSFLANKLKSNHSRNEIKEICNNMNLIYENYFTIGDKR